MYLLKDIEYTFTASFGRSRTGKTVTATILDSAGSVLGAGYTVGSVIELGGGIYGVTVTFTVAVNGYIKWNNTTDTLLLFDPFVVALDNLLTVRKVLTNRWKIASNQLIEYDDDGTTPLHTYDLKKLGAANDGTDPDERDPV